MGIQTDTLEKLANDYTLDGDTIVFRDGRKRGRDPSSQAIPAYMAYVQRTGQMEVTPKEIADELVAILRKRMDATKAVQQIDDAAFVDQMISELGIETGGGKFVRGGMTVKIDEIEKAITVFTHRYNRSIPKVNGKKIAEPFAVDFIKASFYERLFLQKRSDLQKLQDRIRYCGKLDADTLISQFLQMICVEPTTLHKAVIYHWLLNVKKAIYGFPMCHDLHVNLIGPQGCGKTTVVAMLTYGFDFEDKKKKTTRYPGPLEPFATTMKFDKITDPNFFAWGSNYFALGMDEPAGEKGQDLNPKERERYKEIMTAQEFSDRAYFTQSVQRTKRLFSFISTSNRSIARIITDPTGARRIFEFEMNIPKTQKQFEGVFEFPYLDLWRSVDEESPHMLIPGTALHAELEAVQQTYLPMSTITLFLTDSDYGLPVEGKKATEVSLAELYAFYAQFCERLNLTPRSYITFRTDIEDAGVPKNGEKYLIVCK